jgi:hypothetical protein
MQLLLLLSPQAEAGSGSPGVPEPVQPTPCYAAYVMQLLLLLLSSHEDAESGLPGLPEPVPFTPCYADSHSVIAAAAAVSTEGG